jgi:hypothetical protein
LKVEGGLSFMLRHLLGGGVGFLFSSKDDGEGSEIAMADDFAEMFLGKEPRGSDPALDRSDPPTALIT